MRALAAAAVLALGACAADPQQIAGELEKARPCCASIRELPYADLGGGQSDTASFAPGSPVYDFTQGRSYFAAYRIPEGAAPRRMQFVVALEFTPGMPNSAFALSVTELDAGFNTVNFTMPALAYREPGLVTNATLVAAIPLAPATRHVVVHAANDRVGKPFVYTYRATSGGYPVFLGRGAGAIWVPGSSSTAGATADLVRSGSVTVTLSP